MGERMVGVDVGGTKVAAAVLEGTALGEPVVRPTDVSGEDDLLDQLTSTVAELCPDAAAVGIAVPSVVDFATGTARFSVNVPLAHVPLRHTLRERLGIPVYVDNDATCAGLAEAYGDDGTLLARQVVMVTVGTGVGGGIVLDGRIYRGATGAAAEIGHTIIGADLRDGAPAPAERFPQPGSLERLAAGTTLDDLARERGLGDGRAAVAAAQAGDAAAAELVELVAERLGVGLANAINVFDPELIVVGGGVSAAGELLREPAERVARRYALPGVGTCTRIALARYGNESGVRGAALLARTELTADRGRRPAAQVGSP